MRITGGELSGRRLDWTETPGTHPMGERQRLAIFNMLGGIDGVSVLDLYAGSGALGIEALSRGAERCVFVERSRKCAAQIEAALEKLGVSEKAEVIAKPVDSVLRTVSERFDLVFCDPPYDKVEIEAIKAIPKVLAQGGTLVLSHPEGLEVEFDRLKLVKERKYANANISIYLGRT